MAGLCRVSACPFPNNTPCLNGTQDGEPSRYAAGPNDIPQGVKDRLY